MRVKDPWAGHCATTNGRNSLVLDARACPRLVVPKHGRFRSENRYGVLPVNHVVRRAFVANDIILTSALLRKICETAAGIREKATERAED
jgi:hypothetical protein